MSGQKTIRVDSEVEERLLSLRLPGETSHNQVIRRIQNTLERHRLEKKLSAVGLTTNEMGELNWLRSNTTSAS